MKNEKNKQNVEDSEKRLKNLKKVMIAFDVFAFFILILELVAKDFSYSSFIVLILCNIIVFSVTSIKR